MSLTLSGFDVVWKKKKEIDIKIVWNILINIESDTVGTTVH